MRALHIAIAISLIAVGAFGAFALAGSEEVGESGGRRIVLEISDETSKPTKSFEAFDTVQFTVFDFNGDGVKEILAKNDNNWLYIFDSRSGAILFETRESVYGESWGYRELAGAAVGDVNGNGRHDIVGTSTAGFVTVWEMDPSKSSPEKLHFDKLWAVHVKPTMANPKFYEENPWVGKNQSIGFDAAPYLADANGDGSDEIFVQADNLAGHFAFNGKGEMIWGRTWDDGNANPWVADLDGNGKLEVIYATDAGRIWVYDAETGNIRWKFQARDHGAEPGSIALAPGLVDLTGDGKLEVVFGARVAIEDKADPEWYLKQHAMFFALRSDGSMLWKRSFEWGEPHVYMFPAAHDVDGDGKDDAIFVDWNTIGHKPGEWQSTGDPNLFAVNDKGDVLFQTKVSTYWANKNVVVADVDGDGEQDILVNRGGDEDGIAFFDMQGKMKDSLTLPWSASRAPLVTDLYGDGRMHMLVPVAHSRSEQNYRDLDVGYRHGKILVYDMGVPHDASWDNVFLFNLGLDHLYGGEAEDAVRLVVERVETDNGVAVRIESDARVERVEARRAAGNDTAVGLERDADNDEVWRSSELDASEKLLLTVHLENGQALTRTVRAVESEAPAPDDLQPTGPTPDENATPAPGVNAEDNESKRHSIPALGAPGLLLAAALVALGLAASRARQRRRV